MHLLAAVCVVLAVWLVIERESVAFWLVSLAARLIGDE